MQIIGAPATMHEVQIFISAKHQLLDMGKNRRRGSRGFVAMPVSGSVLPSTLASGIVIKSNLMSNLSEDFYCISADLAFQIRDGTVGEGPLQVGIAHGDYSVTEIKEYLDVDYSNPGDKIAREQATRLVRRCGFFQQNLAAAGEQMPQNGEVKRVKIRFLVTDGISLDFWVHNQSGAALSGGATVIVSGTLYGRWVY